MTEARVANRAGRHVAVVGGGLAGMAAALVLAENGCRVDLFEQKHRLGGRVGSFRDPKTGELVDHCMHVSMGCCTNFLDFIRRTDVEDCFSRHRRLTFIGPEGQICKFDSWRWLPAPLHLLPGFARLNYLTLRERLGIGRCLMRLGRLRPDDWLDKTTGQWLRSQGQSQRTIDRFWAVVLVSALGETVDRASLAMAQKVFLDGFMRSPRGYEVLLPKIPLGEIFNRRVGARLQDLGVNVHLGCPVRSIQMNEHAAQALKTADGKRYTFDALILAVPWTTIQRVLSPSQRTVLHPDWQIDRIESSAITAVHLWFDREITSLPHAALVGRTSQWVFRHSPPEHRSTDAKPGRHYQVVVSASHQLANLRRNQLLDQVLADLHAVWPEARSAKLLHHRIVAERDAVFSVAPDSLLGRPRSGTKIDNVCLAGDWTESSWPSTMEGAIFSGYNTAKMLLRKSDVCISLPADSLKPNWLARTLFAPN